MKGYHAVTVRPRAGSAVLFSHQLLHEGCSVKAARGSKGNVKGKVKGTGTCQGVPVTKVVLKTDLVDKRQDRPPGTPGREKQRADHEGRREQTRRVGMRSSGMEGC